MKTIEAMCRGYVRFTVNGKKFWTYGAAVAHRKKLCEENPDGEIAFYGLHVFKGVICFFLRTNVGHGSIINGDYVVMRGNG